MVVITSVPRSQAGREPIVGDPDREADVDDLPDLDDWSDPADGVSWPAGPLDAVQQAFELLVCPPAPLAFDCRGLEGVPQRIVDLDELKHLLIARSTPGETVDQVWSELVIRARRDGPAWVVGAAGIALPALRYAAGRLTRGWRGDVADLDSELLLGFLERLRSIDLDAGNIAGRLVEAGARAVKRARSRHGQGEAIVSGDRESVPPARPWDHPDLVLARGVAAGFIGPEESLLIGATRLEDTPLFKVADGLGISTATARSWRWRAERDLREAITAGELQWVELGFRR
jgi:hypothetical protein